MQDNNKEFDLAVRSLLSDSEERAPRGVWKAVRRELEASGGAVARNSRPASPFRYALPAVLALAALSAVFIIPKGGESTPQTISIVENAPEGIVAQALPQQPEESLEIADIPASGAASAFIEASGKASGEKRLIAGERMDATQIAEAQPEQAAVSSGDVAAAEEKAASESKVSAARQQKTARPSSYRKGYFPMEEADEDYWEEPAERRASIVAVYAKGAIGGNSSDIAFRDRGAMMAPSAGVATTGITELSESTYGVPFTIGLGVRISLFPRVSIGTGVDYSLLTRTFSGKYTRVGDGGIIEKEESGSVFHNLHYIGVPLNIFYEILSARKVNLYTYAGVEAEFAVANNYTLYGNPDIHYSYPVKKPQISTALGLGVEFKLGEHLGLYLDPEVRYYPHCDQPKNVRTDKPVLINFNAGLRFNF